MTALKKSIVKANTFPDVIAALDELVEFTERATLDGGSEDLISLWSKGCETINRAYKDCVEAKRAYERAYRRQYGEG